MSLSVVHLIIMWIWFLGAEIWIFTAMKSDNPRLLWVAGLYSLVALLNGFSALAYQHSGQ